MKNGKVLAIAALVLVVCVSCQTDSARKQAEELTNKGWDIFQHPGQHVEPGEELIPKVIVYFEQAVALDSSYAPALAGLAYRYIPAKNKELGREKAIARAKYFVEKAIQIDPNISIAYVARTAINGWDINNRKDMESNFEKALELDPKNVQALRSYSSWKRWSEGDLYGALELAEKAVELDPQFTAAKLALAEAYHYLGRYDEALEWADKALDEYKGGFSFIRKGEILYSKKDYDSAISVFNDGLAIIPKGRRLRTWLANCYVEKKMFEQAVSLFQELNSQWRLGWVYGLMGEKEKAQEILEDLKKQAEEGQSNAWGIAWVHLGMSDHEKTILFFEKSLEQAIENYWFGNYKYYITNIDDLEVLHSYPRFQALLEKVNSYQVASMN